ncbi:hypothetical protein [Oribacterium sp. P6A1]|uniref:hypothetical protein n=1 Tax=Oribacterium sp. P6A1 TaxID=1410612 RepID=UPI00056BBB5D|nr:hypothetical protein [Oribacterium sp. P6A1]
MIEYQKKPHDEDNRALLKNELKAFIGKDSKKPLNHFVDLVKNHKELELCFRGNGRPRITIYSENHIIFTVLASGMIEISFNHARYCEKWKDYFETLCQKYNFSGTIGKTPSGDITVGTLKRSLKSNQPLSYMQVSSIYEEILKPMFKKYFVVEGKDGVVDYFKHGKKVKVAGKTEKKRQQELYSIFNYTRNGYFFYDMEFSQKHKNINERNQDENNNKPDMQAIKFGKNGLPERIVFVEVKCTKEAMAGNSGLNEHINKMKHYNGLINRRKEACDILNQYAQLGLRGLSHSDSFQYEDFKDLEPEILLVFTDDAKQIWETDASFSSDRHQAQKVEYNNPNIGLYRI